MSALRVIEIIYEMGNQYFGGGEASLLLIVDFVTM
jgi:hypothetical protein